MTNTTTRAQKLILATRPCLTSSSLALGSKAARHSFFDSANGFCPTEDITQLFDQDDKVNAIYDSDNSSLSSPLSMEDPSEQERPLRQPRKTNEGTTLSQLPPTDDPSEEEIIRTSLEPLSKRLAVLPQVFDTTGRLRSGWTHLRPRVAAAKEEKKRQAAANKRTAPLLEAPTGLPISLNAPSAPQTIEKAAVQKTGEPRRWSRSGDPDLPSTHQHGSGLEVRIDLRCARPVKNQFSPSPQANKRLPTIGTFSTPNQKHSDLITNGQRRGQTDKRSSTTTQNHAGHGPFGRTLRSGLPAKPFEAIQSFPIIKFTPHPNQAREFLSLGPAELPSTSNLAREIERSVSDTITAAPSEAKRRLSPLLQSHKADFVLQTLSACEQATAAQFIHDKIPQQQSRNSTFCATCRKNSCSCNPIQEPLEEILCSERECYKKWWGIEDLWKSCGIKLCDAQETKRRFNCWFCPQCSNKARVLLDAVPTSSPFPSANNPLVIVPEGSRHSGPDNGAWPEDAEIREPLQALTGILQQYTGTTTMARNQLTLINQQTPILEIPCIRDEALQSSGTTHNAIYVIRKILDVPEGVLIREKVREVKLQDTTCSIWIRSILSSLLTNFVFHSGSPFEDAALWRKILVKSGHSPDQADNLIHEYRIRVMKAYEASPENPDIPPEFRDRLARRRQAFVEHLNLTMLPLAGGDSNVQTRHNKMANVASELNLKVFAYRGTFEEVNPLMHSLFEPGCHVEENEEPSSLDMEGQAILLTTMVGVRFKHPEKGWRTCSPAKVKVWPMNNVSRDLPQSRVPLPDIPDGSLSEQMIRIGSKKRRIGELD